MQPDSEGIVIIYDGECPFCTAYTKLVRLRQSAGPVRLVDARSGDPLVAEVREAGLDLDRGMVVRYAGETHHGERAMHVLALLSTGSGLVNGAAAALFRSPRLARALYPALVAGRNATLRLLGRRPIGGLPPSGGTATE
jgi:predicted DCC family thiol-disulfide oxidoreductase YuxK